MDSRVPIKDPKERQNPLFEVSTTEKQLWALVQSKGLSQTEVKDLYHKARSGYEKIILNDQVEVEYQDIEYSLWKLHYKHIDEFRKRIRVTSEITDSLKSTPRNAGNVQISIDSLVERFKSFLSEATEFYLNLITKMRRQCGLCEDPLFSDKGGASSVVAPKKVDKCRYSCHRFLVCLGDLARYREECKKLDSGGPDWSVAATHYFKATQFWPDSGNPQNQLALLAKHIGDDFIALYHCIRSLAIKEPFPDARNNLILLFEENRSSHLDSLSKAAHFDFLNPSERSTSPAEPRSSSGSSNDETPLATGHISSTKCDIWPLFVRMTSFFFIESSFEEFPCTFASTMRELDSLLALDETKLKASLESYQHMDSSRTGPYRALQMVSILIFVIDSLTQTSDHKDSVEKNNIHQQLILESSLTATFICLGRLAERCLKVYSDSEKHSPLMPAVLVFVEWLVGMLDKLKIYGGHEKVGRAISYFVDAFVGLLNRLNKSDSEFNCREKSAALWEDYELRGFTPLSNAHASLYFMTDQKVFRCHDSEDTCCDHRILRAAMRIVKSSKLIFYDNLARNFFTAESQKLAGQREEAKVVQSNSGLGSIMSGMLNCEAAEEDGKATITSNEIQHLKNGKAGPVDEEEVILFKPITRYNSAPMCPSTTKDDMSKECETKDHPAPSDERLRRATSLFSAQDQTQDGNFSFRVDDSNFRYNKPLKQQEPLLKDPPAYPSGPPSLSSWVFNRETSNTEKEKGRNEPYKSGLTPIAEIPLDSLTGLSIGETEDSLIDSIYVSSPCFSTPVPSAPLLPDDAIWFTGNPSTFSEVKNNGNVMKEGNGILGAPPLSSYSNFSATHRPLGVAYQAVGGMSSSEWLYQYSNQNLGNFYGYDGSRFDLCDRWGNPVCPNRMVYLDSTRLYSGSPLSYSGDKERREMAFRNFQRPSPHGCVGGTELGTEQPPLLHYLKEREWQLQQQQQVRSPAAYMGN